MIIGKNYIKYFDVEVDIAMKLIRSIPSTYIVKLSSVLMVKKNGIIYELKNKYYVDDIKSKDLLEEISITDFKVISMTDFVDDITGNRKFEFKNEREFVVKLIESLNDKFILFNFDEKILECPGCGCNDNNHAQECTSYYNDGYGKRK